MPNNLSGAALAIVVLAVSLSILAVSLRILSRCLGRNFGRDDSLIIVALILAITHAGLSVWFIKLTYVGYHVKDIPLSVFALDRQLKIARVNIARALIYAGIFGFARGSAIVFLLRLEGYREKMRIWLHFLLGLNFTIMTAAILADLLACKPVHYQWDYPKMVQFRPDGTVDPRGTCEVLGPLGTAVTSMTIIMDVLVLITPMAMVWKLRMPRSSKVVAVLVLSFGWVATGVSIAQLTFYTRTLGGKGSNAKDPTYSLIATFTNIESNLAIIAASIPALKALCKRIFPHSKIFTFRNRQGPSPQSVNFISWGPLRGETASCTKECSSNRHRGMNLCYAHIMKSRPYHEENMDKPSRETKCDSLLPAPHSAHTIQSMHEV